MVGLGAQLRVTKSDLNLLFFWASSQGVREIGTGTFTPQNWFLRTANSVRLMSGCWWKQWQTFCHDGGDQICGMSWRTVNTECNAGEMKVSRWLQHWYFPHFPNLAVTLVELIWYRKVYFVLFVNPTSFHVFLFLIPQLISHGKKKEKKICSVRWHLDYRATQCWLDFGIIYTVPIHNWYCFFVTKNLK